MGTRLNRARVLLLLGALLTGVAGQWSSAVALSVGAGSFTTPGAVSSSGLRLWVDSSEQGSLGLNPRVRFWFDKSGESRHLSNVPFGVVPHATAVALRQQVVFEDGALAIGQPIPLNSLTAFYVIRGGSDTGYHLCSARPIAPQVSWSTRNGCGRQTGEEASSLPCSAQSAEASS